MRQRLIVVGILRRQDGCYLLCRMPPHRGVFPGQWGLPGGGVEEGELIEDALRRELREELQLEVASAEPLYFKAEQRSKLYPDGRRESLYMVFLIYLCQTTGGDPTLSEEFDSFAWVGPADLASYDLNVATRETLRQVGILTG
jgi:nucleoside triphosphatase